jgi:hypothetical protein
VCTPEVARLREKLSSEVSATSELQKALADRETALQDKELELQKSAADCLELRDRVSSLRRDTHRFWMRYDRAKESRSQAVEKAVTRVTKHYESAGTRRVKCPDGRIEDWVRDLVVELVALDGVPTAKVPQVIERVRRSFANKGNDEHDEHDEQGGGNDNQIISDRSVRRIMCESYVKAFMYAAQLFGSAPC